VSGSRLAFETYQQAWSFGATFIFIRQVNSLSSANGHFRLGLSDGNVLAARSVVIATGASYRQLDVASLEHVRLPHPHDRRRAERGRLLRRADRRRLGHRLPGVAGAGRRPDGAAPDRPG
jgi:hypothetical protein